MNDLETTDTVATGHVTVHEVLHDPDFVELMRKKTVVSISLTFATMIVYYGFIFLVAFHKEFLAIKVTENITMGIPVGIGVILFTCCFTGIYVIWANRNYDPAVKAFKRKLGDI